jgi:hypothetical protein
MSNSENRPNIVRSKNDVTSFLGIVDIVMRKLPQIPLCCYVEGHCLNLFLRWPDIYICIYIKIPLIKEHFTRAWQ